SRYTYRPKGAWSHPCLLVFERARKPIHRALDDRVRLQHRVLTAAQDRLNLARQTMQLIEAERHEPIFLIALPREYLRIGQIVFFTGDQGQRFSADGVEV